MSFHCITITISKPALVAQLDACLTGDQEVLGLIPVGLATFIHGDMIYFPHSFSPFHWYKKSSCHFLAKECAQDLVDHLVQEKCGKVNWPAWRDLDGFTGLLNLSSSIRNNTMYKVLRRIGLSKQCRPRSDATEYSIWSGSTLFAQACPFFGIWSRSTMFAQACPFFGIWSRSTVFTSPAASWQINT